MGRLQRGTWILFGVRDMFMISILVLVSQAYTFIKTDQIAHFKCVRWTVYLTSTVNFFKKRIRSGKRGRKKRVSFQRQNRLNLEDHRH